MSDENDSHITGRYTIIAVLVGLIGAFGAVLLNHYLETNREKNEKKLINPETIVAVTISWRVSLVVASRTNSTICQF